MSSDTTEGRDRLTSWLVGASVALAAVLAVAAVVWSWPTQAVANSLQLLGIALTAVGVAVVRSWLQLAADKAVDAKHGLARWSALRRQQLRDWWARRRGRPPQAIYGEGIASSEAFGSGTVTVGPPAVDRTTISDRDWLAYLDNELDNVRKRLRDVEQRHTDDLNRRLGAQRDELRAEIQRETRQGWQLILAGLAWSAVGTAVGIFG